MTALRQPQVPHELTEEMARLQSAGFSLLPLGAGTDGKGPMVKFRAREHLHLGRILGPMHRSGSTCYGVRLGGLAVIDCDTDDPQLISDMEARFGASPVHVKTPRGMHLYYSADGGPFPNLRGDGLPVDIKRGATSYVMGPGSVRPDGGSYIPAKGVLGHDALPEIRAKAAPPPSVTSRDGRVAEGGRNYALTVAAIQMVECVDDPEELLGNLQFIRDDQCENPATVPDAELRKIAGWAWACRLEGRVYMGRNSEFRLHREALDAILSQPNASDALALFVVLQSQHGHRPAVTFPLDHSAMKDAGYTDLSRRRFLDARRVLECAGVLEVGGNHRAAHHRRSYRLVRHRRSMLAAANVAQLRPNKGGGV